MTSQDPERSDGKWYAKVHNNSGEFTYGDVLCPGAPTSCNPDIEYSVKANIEEGSNFDSFTGSCGNISKALSAKGCNKEALVMWFNQGTNKSYNSVLDDNSIFDIKNVDECEHIIISDNGIREGGQKFEDSSYNDSGFPSIAKNPCSSTEGGKYNTNGNPYPGHKIKYHVISDTIPARFYENHDELVEIYFPHLYSDNDPSGKNTRYIKQSAFQGCHRLSAITFSKVEEIELNAFTDCYGLKKIDWGHVDCCKSNMKKIGAFVFDNCSGLTELCLDKLVVIEEIGSYAFDNCTSVTAFTLPTASTYSAITDGCFANLAKGPNLDIPSNIKKIGYNSFKDYGRDLESYALTMITIPSSIKEMDQGAFENTSTTHQNGFTLNWNKTGSGANLKLTDASGNEVVFGNLPFGPASGIREFIRGGGGSATIDDYKTFFNNKGWTGYADKAHT